jgi:hypothetical protein
LESLGKVTRVIPDEPSMEDADGQIAEALACPQDFGQVGGIVYEFENGHPQLVG